MSGSSQLVDSQEPGTSKEAPAQTDWTKCVLCQEDKPESLQCPAKSNRNDVGIGRGYSTLSTNIVHFSELHELPIPIDLHRLDDGNGIEATLLEHKAKWHKSCHSKFNATKLKRAEKRKSASKDSDTTSVNSRKYTRQSVHSKAATDACFFCEDVSTTEPLREASTFGLDSRVRRCALDLQDEHLLAKLSAGDMVAQDAKYHPRCLVALYGKAAKLQDNVKENTTDRLSRGIALAELLTYIEEAKLEADTVPVFKLADLVKLYSDRLQQLGVKHARPHSTLLKTQILAHFPDLTAHKEGRDVLLAFDRDIGLALRKACDAKYDEEAICLAKAANIVRRDMLQMQAAFSGSFDKDCQVKSVPQSLLTMVVMILNGSNIKFQSDEALTQPALTISQLLQFNTVARRRAESNAVRHSKARETPLPIYVGLAVHAKTRKRELVDTLFNLGLSISYDRVLAISTAVGNSVCEQYHRDQAVCPPNLRRGLFTTSAVDNIDHNPSATTATDSFHGTGISLFQHPRPQNHGTDRRKNFLFKEVSTSKQLEELPESYTNVPPLVLTKKDAPMPRTVGPVKGDGQAFQKALQEELGWLEIVGQQDLQDVQDSNISWAAYHASKQPVPECPQAITALLPLFPDESKSVAMIRHAMDQIMQAVQKLNPGQVPVITFDQPLYTIAKQIQWNWPSNYGEDKFVILLGGLHIEMATLKVLGDWLEDSGWVEAVIQAKMASAGTAESYLKASHVTRTRHAHQVTASSLYILLKKSYAYYKGALEQGAQPEVFEAWCIRKKREIPQFQFWYIALELELLLLAYVRSLRESNFLLYVDCLTKLAPWFFSLDHTNYARWVSVHVRDMMKLTKSNPDVAAEFKQGNFTVRKTRRPFSCMALDQAHEQNNADVKSDGGAIGLTQNPDALRRWMVAGPEVVRMTTEFESSIEAHHKKMTPETRHHEQTNSFQVKFAQQVTNMVEVMEEMGNPFLEKTKDLLKLDTRDIVDPAVVSSVRQAEQIGYQQYEKFQSERLLEQSTPISDAIKKNKLSLFSRPPPRQKTNASLQLSSLKSDCSLFSRLYIACQSRDGDLDDFFRHENQACPPALSKFGKLRLGTKSDLLVCLETCAESKGDVPDTHVTILDGAAVVNILKPITAKTFDDYALNVFLPYIKRQLQHASRVDIVWDQYIKNSLKSQTREKRGKGIRRRVDGSTTLPGNWKEFLRISANKTELFAFLTKHLADFVTDKQVVTTNDTEVICIPPRDTSRLAPCDHEEADTRMILHLGDAFSEGYQKILLRTVDTDVVVLAVAAAAKLKIQELWVAFGTGKNLRYIPAHEIAASIGPDKSQALPLFHAYTGCDTVSSFNKIGKKKAWDTWKVFEEVTPTFLALASGPTQIDRADLDVLERFTILLYDRTSSSVNVDKARQEMFTNKGRAMDAIPPSRAALEQHIKRAVYQGGHCWGRSLEVSMAMPSPESWGWIDPCDWKPMWTTLPEASKSSRELIRCGCKLERGCRGRCKCRKAALKCTALCQPCGGLYCDV